jgi:hypothetical protein
MAASSTLHLGISDDVFAARVRDVFDAIPPAALVANPAQSEMEAFRQALKISLALVVFAAIGGRRDLHHILKLLHMGVLAVDERSRGVDEPFLRAIRSPRSPREDHYTKCVKTWCAMAGHALISMGMPRKEAARKVADVVNRHAFLPRKRSGISVGWRSVLNWMARWDDGDLRFCPPSIAFGDAFNLLEQGQPSAAQRKLLNLLIEGLNERKNFQLYPRETSAVS